MKSSFFTHPIMKLVDGIVNSLPRPINISVFWNFGFLLRIRLILQIITGIFLAFHYTRRIELAFSRVDHILRDVNNGWLVRILHRNGASFFFICIFLHVGRGIYYESYKFEHTWYVGIIIFLVRIRIAFLGYVLPWGQISFWGATVITNLFSVIPYAGESVVNWLWGGFSVGGATLTRFFCFHFLFPFILLALVGVHLIFLHETGSRNPLGVNRNFFKVTFNPFFLVKDLVGLFVMMLLLEYFVFFSPWILADPENFIPANSLVTPPHIQPEWYFLFAYAILRSVPSKVGGVIALLSSLLILFTMPRLDRRKIKGRQFNLYAKIFFWIWVSSVLVLTWIGARPVDGDYIIIGEYASSFYFSFFFRFSQNSASWDEILEQPTSV